MMQSYIPKKYKRKKSYKNNMWNISHVPSPPKKEPLGVNFLHKLSDMDPIHVPSLPVAPTLELSGKKKDNGDDNKTVPTATT
eukprot:6412620-Ditylum_brightwellii.AAC.1